MMMRIITKERRRMIRFEIIHISQPLTNAMYDALDPLYHELDAKNLPLIDPRLTMSNFYHQEKQKYDEEQKVLRRGQQIANEFEICIVIHLDCYCMFLLII
eukprot:158337_1